MAELLDVPVLIHTEGIAGGSGSSPFRIAHGHPEHLQEVLVRHPKMRIWLENAAYPFLEGVIALMYRYPQVYADVSTITWLIPRAEFWRYFTPLMILKAGVETESPPRLSDRDVGRLDPYQFMAVLGKKVIHPGGRRSTEEVLRWAELRPDLHVLDVGAGVGTTAIEIVRRFGCRVTSVDIDPNMVVRARANVQAAGLSHAITVAKADIQALEFPDHSFDRVVIEAVTMFVDRDRAAREVIRVCRPLGRVLDHEFIYLRPPTPEVRRIFEGEICPGIRFSTAEDWLELFHAAGLRGLQCTTGPFQMMTPSGMWRDEGCLNLARMILRVTTRTAYLRKMTWLMSRILRVRSSLGYVVLVGTKPATHASRDAA